MGTVADFLVSRLRAAGVRMLFGVPGGGSNLDVIEAARHIDLPFVLTATETAAALAATAQAEITGAPGACLTTLGPGATSVVNGVACAYLDRAPLIVFTDSHPSSAEGRFEHQRVEHPALMAPITTWQATLTPDNAAAIVNEALARAVAPRPGPVHIDCPGDVAAMPSVSRPHERQSIPVPISREAPSGSPEPQAIPIATFGARRPLLLVGLGAHRADDAAAIRRFIERRNVPALVTYKAKGVVPDDHPLFAGVLTNARVEQATIDHSDLLIGVGLDPVELIPRAWTNRQPIVYCGRWPVEARQVPFAAQWIGEIAPALEQLEPAMVSEWDIGALHAAVQQQRLAVDVAAAGLTAQGVVRTAAARLAGMARVVVDAGAHMFAATMLWPIAEPNGMLISNGLSTMGFALPAAVGAALLDRGRPVVALTGDGGLLMCASELLTAARERLKILVIVFSDASLSLIEIKQRARKFASAGVALGAVDWPRLAESFGLAGFRAGTAGELARAIDDALAVDGPALIEATIDRGNYGATLRAIRG